MQCTMIVYMEEEYGSEGRCKRFIKKKKKNANHEAAVMFAVLYVIVMPYSQLIVAYSDALSWPQIWSLICFSALILFVF